MRSSDSKAEPGPKLAGRPACFPSSSFQAPSLSFHHPLHVIYPLCPFKQSKAKSEPVTIHFFFVGIITIELHHLWRTTLLLNQMKTFFLVLLPLNSIISEGQLFCLTRRKLFMLQVIPSTVAEVVHCDQMKHLISLNVIPNLSNAA